MLLILFNSMAAKAQTEVVLLTTSTVENSGLLRYLLAPLRQADSAIAVRAVVSSSGQVFASVRKTNGDLILTHDPEGEQDLFADNLLQSSYLFMHNDFLLVGPADDPAQAAAATSMLSALARVHQSQGTFLARSDLSGTSRKELQLWSLLGINPQDSDSYLSSGQGMGATLLIAYEMDAYSLSDSATWFNFPQNRRPQLIKRQQQDPLLRNQYSLSITAHANPASWELKQWLCQEGQLRLRQFTDTNGTAQFNPDDCELKWPTY